MIPSTTLRRSAAYAAGFALVGSALVAGSGAANADAITDVSGVVTNAAGAPLADAFVTAYVQSGNQFFAIDGDTTDAAGNYALTDVDAASRALNYDSPTDAQDIAIRNATSVKLFFSKGIPDAELHSNPGYLSRGYGGAKTLTNSTAVPVNGAAVGGINQALPAAGGMIVRITGATGAPVTAGGNVNLVGAGQDDLIGALSNNGGNTSSDDDFYDNPATPATEPAPVDGLVYVYGIEPGSYAVNAGGADGDVNTGAFRSYLSRFIGGDGTYAKASAITVTAGAFASTGVQLTDVLSATEAPRIVGNSSFGSKLTAEPGTWLIQQGTEFKYQWTRNGAPVAGATTSTYSVTKADKKKRIGVTVTAVASQVGFSSTGNEFVGTASAAPTSKVGEKSKVKAKKSGDGFAVTVTVAKKKLAKKIGTPKGKIVLYTTDGEIASKKVKLKGGKASITPKAAFAGEKKFVVAYLGGGKLGSDTANAKLGGGKKK